MNNFNNNNEQQETVRQTLDRVWSEKEREKARQQALEYADKIKSSARKNLPNDIVMSDKNLSPIQKIANMTWNNYTDYNPLRRVGETLGTLHSAKQEMDQMHKDGYDNYAHRYGMYNNAQDGIDKAVYTFGAGIAKEGWDFLRKIPFNGEFWSQSNKLKKIGDTLQDNWKDIKNNYEAVKSGLQNPKTDGRLWLKDFDYETNTWKK